MSPHKRRAPAEAACAMTAPIGWDIGVQVQPASKRQHLAKAAEMAATQQQQQQQQQELSTPWPTLLHAAPQTPAQMPPPSPAPMPQLEVRPNSHTNNDAEADMRADACHPPTSDSQNELSRALVLWKPLPMPPLPLGVLAPPQHCSNVDGLEGPSQTRELVRLLRCLTPEQRAGLRGIWEAVRDDKLLANMLRKLPAAAGSDSCHIGDRDDAPCIVELEDEEQQEDGESLVLGRSNRVAAPLPMLNSSGSASMAVDDGIADGIADMEE